jgi:glutamyl-tRNA reductase
MLRRRTLSCTRKCSCIGCGHPIAFASAKGVEAVTSAMIGSSPVLDSEVSGTIISLRERFEAVRRNEIRRMRGRLGNLSSDQENVVESLSRGIVEKVLQAPVEMLLTIAVASHSDSILETVRKIFNLPR